MGRRQTMPKFDYQSQFSMSKIIRNFFFFFEYQFRSTFLVFDIFDNIINKMIPNFWQLATTQILKIQWFPLGMLILRQKYFKFCTPPYANSTTRTTIMWVSASVSSTNLVFCYQNCSELRDFFSFSSEWEIRGWRLRICKSFEITWTIYSNSERSEQFLVTECFFNLFLEVSQI